MTDGLSDRARSLVDAAKAQGGPTRAQQAKMAGAVVAATSSTAAAFGTGAGTTVTASASMTKLVGAGVLAALVGMGGTVAVSKAVSPRPRPPLVERGARVDTTPVVERTQPSAETAPVAELTTSPGAALPEAVEPEVVPVVERAPVVAAPPSARPSPAAAPAATPRPPEPETPAVAASPEPAPAPTSTRTPAPDTTAEVTALATAMEALDAHDFAQALSVARATRRASPTGVLRPELTLLEIEALCGLGRTDEAQDVADAMPQADRTTLVLGRLRRSCVSLK
jgi:hypothetical protein